MGGTGVIDNFLGTFTRYIDSGFGLVQGDVRWLAGVLIAIDITLAGLFWAMAPDEDVLARLIKKTLYIGVFAFIIGNYNNLAQIIYNSFAGLGIEAGGGTINASQLLQPGKIAEVGIDAGKPILTAISGMMGFTSVFANLVQIIILLVAWLIVIISFFVMAIQLFVSLIEFKLTTLAGFVLVPFGLFGRTAFLAERVLGNVVSSGIKILVLAVIIGIGSTIFNQFTSGFNNPPTISDALTLILYFSIIPVTVGLVAAALIRKLGGSRLASVSRTVLFLPQVIPLVAAGIMWTWLLAADGAVNQFLSAIGLGGITRAWLGDFDTALPAVGVIGAWVSLGLCMLLLLAGMTKIDPALYEAARIDGAGPIREFFTVTLPAIRQELGVAVLITVIGALRSFDIIYISTQGGPGRSTMVPGLEIYYLAFFERQVGQASALAVVLTLLVLAVVLPLNKLTRGKDES